MRSMTSAALSIIGRNAELAAGVRGRYRHGVAARVSYSGKHKRNGMTCRP
jgi:hypothetical protein